MLAHKDATKLIKDIKDIKSYKKGREQTFASHTGNGRFRYGKQIGRHAHGTPAESVPKPVP